MIAFVLAIALCVGAVLIIATLALRAFQIAALFLLLVGYFWIMGAMAISLFVGFLSYLALDDLIGSSHRGLALAASGCVTLVAGYCLWRLLVRELKGMREKFQRMKSGFSGKDS